MAITEARKKANHKWDEANRDRYWKCTVRFPAEDKIIGFRVYPAARLCRHRI